MEPAGHFLVIKISLQLLAPKLNPPLLPPFNFNFLSSTFTTGGNNDNAVFTLTAKVVKIEWVRILKEVKHFFTTVKFKPHGNCFFNA